MYICELWCVWGAILSFVESYLWWRGEVTVHFWGMFFIQIIYIGIVFETIFSSSVKYTHKQKDTENSTFHIKLLKHHG